jgi:hypothetical protein
MMSLGSLRGFFYCLFWSQLWQTTLKHAPVMVPQLLALFPHLVAVMEKSFDHLQVIMRYEVFQRCFALLDELVNLIASSVSKYAHLLLELCFCLFDETVGCKTHFMCHSSVA